MYIGICDDETKQAEIIMKCCEKVREDVQQEFQYQVFDSGEKLLAYNGDIDILFLDIEMNGMNGIDTMKMLEDKDNVKNIFFISSHSDYVFDTFGVKTRGFLCKPIAYDRFSREVKRVIDRQQRKMVVEIPMPEKHIYVPIEEIIYLSGEGKYVRIVGGKDIYVICGSLKAWEEKLSQYNFARIHKSYLVNLEFVSNIKDVVTLKIGREQLPVGRKYKETGRSAYKEYMLRKFRGRIDDR